MRNNIKDDDASIFSAYEKYRKEAQLDPIKNPSIQVMGNQKSGNLYIKFPARISARIWHKGNYLSETRINNIVKARYVKNNGDARRHLVDWLRYIQDRERSAEEPERKFFDRKRSDIERNEVKEDLLANRTEDKAFFKLMLSPKQNELDHELYTCEIMERWEEATNIKTNWYAVKHENTLHHHVHLVLPARDVDGYPYRIEREHLNLMREIANEYQYELQDRQYQYEKDIEYELQLGADMLDKMLERQEGDELLKELGLNSASLEKDIAELLPTTNLDDITFRSKLENDDRNSEDTTIEADSILDQHINYDETQISMEWQEHSVLIGDGDVYEDADGASHDEERDESSELMI